jgi:hypothetical protein
VSRRTIARIGFFLWGMAMGALVDGVQWTFWLFWAMAWTAFGLVIWWHRHDRWPYTDRRRNGNGGPAHA